MGANNKTQSDLLMGDDGWRLQTCLILILIIQPHFPSHVSLLFSHKICTFFLPFLVKLNAFIFNGIDFWVDAFYLDICWHISDTEFLVEYLSIVVYYFDFSLVNVVLESPKIRWVTRTFLNFFWWWAETIFFVFTIRRLWKTIVSLSER